MLRTPSLRKLLFLFWVAAGVAITFLVPPFQIPDEVAHWKTALYRAQGFGERERCVPGMQIADSFHYDEQGPKAGTGFHSIPKDKGCLDAEVYYGSVLSYPGVLLAKWIGGKSLSPRKWMWVFYLSRIFQGFFVAIFLARFLRRVQGPGVHVIQALALSPLFLQQAFGVSADGVTLAFTLLSVSWLLSDDSLALNKKTFLFFVLGLIASTTKAPMLLLGLFVVAVAWRRRQARTSDFTFLALTFAWIAITLISGAQGSKRVVAFNEFTPGFHEIVLPKGPVDADAQAHWMLRHPVDTAKTFLRPMGEFLHLQSYAGKLGWWSVASDRITIRLWQFLVLAMLLVDCGWIVLRRMRDPAPPPLRVPAVWLSGAVAAIGVSILLQIAGVYMGFTPVGYPEVLGLQPRYFFPQLIFIFALGFWVCTRWIDPASARTAPRLREGMEHWGKLALIWVFFPLWMSSLALDFFFRFQQ